jgi:hypothetical protein
VRGFVQWQQDLTPPSAVGTWNYGPWVTRLGPSSAAPREEETVPRETKDAQPFVNKPGVQPVCVVGIGMASPFHVFVEVWTSCFLLGHDSGVRCTRKGISNYDIPEVWGRHDALVKMAGRMTSIARSFVWYSLASLWSNYRSLRFFICYPNFIPLSLCVCFSFVTSVCQGISSTFLNRFETCERAPQSCLHYHPNKFPFLIFLVLHRDSISSGQFFLLKILSFQKTLTVLYSLKMYAKSIRSWPMCSYGDYYQYTRLDHVP